MIQAVLFDMDGVLLDSEAFGMGLLPHIAACRGYNMTPEVYRQILGVSGVRSKEILLGHFGPDYPHDEIMGQFWQAMLEAAKEGRLPQKPGAETCLAELRARGLKLALCTSTARSTVEVYQQGVSFLRGAFDVVVCGTDVARSKPAPDIFLQAAEQLGIAPDHCLGVEDSRSGLAAVTAAGMASVMIPDLVPYDESMQNTVTYRLESLFGLSSLIAKINEERSSHEH